MVTFFSRKIIKWLVKMLGGQNHFGGLVKRMEIFVIDCKHNHCAFKINISRQERKEGAASCSVTDGTRRYRNVSSNLQCSNLFILILLAVSLCWNTWGNCPCSKSFQDQSAA